MTILRRLSKDSIEDPFFFFGALGGLSFEPFFSWIYKIMLAYQDKFHDPDELTFKDNMFSKGYYTRKVN